MVGNYSLVFGLGRKQLVAYSVDLIGQVLYTTTVERQNSHWGVPHSGNFFAAIQAHAIMMGLASLKNLVESRKIGYLDDVVHQFLRSHEFLANGWKNNIFKFA